MTAERLNISAIRKFMERRDLLDAPGCTARNKVELQWKKLVQGTPTLMMTLFLGSYWAWKGPQFWYWVLLVTTPLGFVAMAYEISMTWRLKRRFEQTGAQSFDELATHGT